MDAHTHLTGQENAEQLLECMDICGVEKAFVFAPMLNVQALGEGSPAREEYRDMIFYRNALDHWQNAIREPRGRKRRSGRSRRPGRTRDMGKIRRPHAVMARKAV